MSAVLTQERLARLSPESRAFVRQVLDQAEAGNAEEADSALAQLWQADYDSPPVDIVQFVEDPYYLGGQVKDLSNIWKEELSAVFAPQSRVLIWILTGAVGTGKTTVGSIGMVYLCYRMSRLHDPAVFYGLLPGSRIVLGVFNITLDKADTGYDMMKMFVDQSPYFREACPRRKRPDEPLYFPDKNILVALGSLEEHALGENVFGIMLDEANFFKRSRRHLDPLGETRAHQILNQSKIRMMSRYMKRGIIPGLVTLISSRRYQSDFLDDQIERAKQSPDTANTIRVTALSHWESKPASNYCGKTFEVLIGTDKVPSRVLESDEISPVGVESVVVPVEYLSAFEDDVDQALRDIAGVSTVGERRFFQPVRVEACVDHSRAHPMSFVSLDDISLGSGNRIEDYLDVRALCRIERSRWVPVLNPGAGRFIHIDIGLTQDALGFAMGHPKLFPDGLVGVYYDLLLQVRARAGSEVELLALVEFIDYLRSLGFPVAKITFDSFQSRMPMQILVSHGFQAELMGIRLEHYNVLKDCINAKRCSYYEFPPVLAELKGLIRSDKERPNHPPNGSDDVADALAGVAAHCCGFSDRRKFVAPPLARSQALGTGPIMVIGTAESMARS